MERVGLTEKLLDIKREHPWAWKHICGKIGGYSEVLIVGAILGPDEADEAAAAKAGDCSGCRTPKPDAERSADGTGTPMPPTDPLIYRFYEMVMVNGPAWKALIEEEFGDGIMSAIDFDLQIDRLANPKGDRVQLAECRGKFLPYKYYSTREARPAGIWVQGGVT